MARSSCPKCAGFNFEIKEFAPYGSAFKLMSVQCSSCGSVVGALEYFNSGAKIEKLEKQIAVVENNQQKIIQQLNQILTNLRR
jgi:transcription initiation factor IIE alpha subunit